MLNVHELLSDLSARLFVLGTVLLLFMCALFVSDPFFPFGLDENVRLFFYAGITIFIFMACVIFQFVFPLKSLLDRLKKLEHPEPFLLKRRDDIGALSIITNTLLKDFKELSSEYDKDLIRLEKAEKIADQALASKSDFLANMSHELRTPLSGIVGMTELMRLDDLPKDVFESMAVIETSSRQLLDIVNNILDVARIEAGEVVLNNAPFDLETVFDVVKKNLRPQADHKGLELEFEKLNEPLYIVGDSIRLNRVLTHLMDNAIQYTDQGFVRVLTKILHENEESIALRVEVHDSGIGIKEEDIDDIFEKFVQVDESSTRRFGGTGLGLTITKELVTLMGGKIVVRSKYGVGSTFSFEIPFERAPEKLYARDVDNGKGAHKKRSKEVNVLVAEDQKINQLYLKKLFKTLQISRYDIVENGKLALGWHQKNDYDFILMDCHMPEMNGYDATTAIRALSSEQKSQIPIIAITANAMPEDEEKCLSIGMDAYISKPISLDRFKATLSPWVDFSGIEKFPDHKSLKSVEEEPQSKPPADLEKLRQNMQCDDDFIKEIAEMFIVQVDTQLKKLEKECKDGENEAWVDVAHALKGTAAGIYAEDMRKLCAEAQKLVNAEKAQRERMLEEISAASELVRNYLYKVCDLKRT